MVLLSNSLNQGKWAYEEYLQKSLLIFLFLSDLSLYIVKIWKAYN